jgi:hypothetical protein
VDIWLVWKLQKVKLRGQMFGVCISQDIYGHIYSHQFLDPHGSGYLARVETTEGETAGIDVWRMYFTRHL